MFVSGLTMYGIAVTWIITDGQYDSVSEVMSLVCVAMLRPID